MVVNIQAQGMEMTDALKEYTQEKAESLKTYFEGIIQIDAHIGLLSQGQKSGKIYFCEMVVHVPNKKLVVKKEAEDLYKSIDKVRDHLKVEFEKIKGKMNTVDRKEVREAKEYEVDVLSYK